MGYNHRLFTNGHLPNMEQAKNLLREIPSVDRLLKHPRSERLLERYNREYITRKCREAVDEIRKALRQGKPLPHEELQEESILSQIETKIASEGEPKLKRVINATGTVLHTNLGRAVLPQAAIDALSTIGRHPVNLEYDLIKGKRGKREEPIENALLELTGAQAATVVNNNAAAVLLGLNTFAFGRFRS